MYVLLKNIFCLNTNKTMLSWSIFYCFAFWLWFWENETCKIIHDGKMISVNLTNLFCVWFERYVVFKRGTCVKNLKNVWNIYLPVTILGKLTYHLRQIFTSRIYIPFYYLSWKTILSESKQYYSIFEKTKNCWKQNICVSKNENVFLRYILEHLYIYCMF